MTGPEHYLTAERLLSAARGPQGKATDEEFATLEAAQVHATLALAAATATSRGSTDPYDWVAWKVATGTEGQS